jgi:hypothetical protein
MLALAAAALGALAGCGSEHWVEWRVKSLESPSGIILSEDRIEIPVGVAVWAEAIAIEDDEKVTVKLDFVPASPIVGIEPHVDDGTWILYGVQEGVTKVDIYFGEEQVDEVDAFIVSNLRAQ